MRERLGKWSESSGSLVWLLVLCSAFFDPSDVHPSFWLEFEAFATETCAINDVIHSNGTFQKIPSD